MGEGEGRRVKREGRSREPLGALSCNHLHGNNSLAINLETILQASLEKQQGPIAPSLTNRVQMRGGGS